MEFWNIVVAMPPLVSVPVAVLVALGLRRRRPRWSRVKVALLSSLLGSAGILLLGGYLLATVAPASPGAIDSGGMVIAAIMMLMPLYALLGLAVGALSAYLAQRPTGPARPGKAALSASRHCGSSPDRPPDRDEDPARFREQVAKHRPVEKPE